jgi:hypothetical protein
MAPVRRGSAIEPGIPAARFDIAILGRRQDWLAGRRETWSFLIRWRLSLK